MKEISIIWHSRAGQGAVTASNALAKIMGERGFFVQSFPEFGAEKRGAHIKVFTRISEKEILPVSHILHPKVIIILDTTLIGNELNYENAIAGSDENSILIINTPQEKTHFNEIFKGSIYHIDASKIAIDEIKRDIPNVPIIGTLIFTLEIGSEKELLPKIKENLGKLPEKVIEGNLKAFKRGMKEIKKYS